MYLAPLHLAFIDFVYSWEKAKRSYCRSVRGGIQFVYREIELLGWWVTPVTIGVSEILWWNINIFLV